MGQQTLDGDDVGALRAEYDRLVTRALPAAARCAGDWPIREDHCFARVVLDTVFADVWYDHVDGRPAVRHLPAADLRHAVAVADRMFREGRPTVTRLNERSLRRRDASE